MKCASDKDSGDKKNIQNFCGKLPLERPERKGRFSTHLTRCSVRTFVVHNYSVLSHR
jgi:hypothetical protein